MRAILNDSGTVQATTSYDAWGVPQSSAIAPFGFTGELQSGSDVWLRARWYGAGWGAFGGRDAFAGSSETPYSLMPYQYAYAAPTMWTDPSGECVAPPIYKLYPNGTYIEETCVKPYLSSIKQVAATYGLPWQIVAGVLEAEIELDTDFKDTLENLAYMLLPGSARFRDSPGPGVGNIHVATAVKVSAYMAENYADCSAMQLNFHTIPKQTIFRGHTYNDEAGFRAKIAHMLVDTNTNLQAFAAILRYLADYRFGSNGQPARISHANLQQWLLTDALVMWHGYRYGVPDISPDGQGFKDLAGFQNRNLTIGQMLARHIIQGKDSSESFLSAVDIFEYFLAQP